MSTLKIGFIGLGIMGKPMALNVSKAGFPLFVHTRNPASLKPLVDAGAQACDSPQDLAANVDAVITMVSDTPDVEQVVFGEQGVIHGARPGTMVIDMSTISPVATREFAKRLSEQGIDMLDAPVSGGDIGAINATLSIMVGGKPGIFTRAKPLLEAMGKNIVHVGDHGAGQVTKMCNNLVAAITIEAVAEAFAFARRCNVDVAKVRDALLGGFAYSKVLELHGKRMLENDFRPGFKARLHQKDLRIALENAEQLGLVLPATALVAQHLNALVDGGGGDLDSSAIAKVVQNLSQK